MGEGDSELPLRQTDSHCIGMEAHYNLRSSGKTLKGLSHCALESTDFIPIPFLACLKFYCVFLVGRCMTNEWDGRLGVDWLPCWGFVCVSVLLPLPVLVDFLLLADVEDYCDSPSFKAVHPSLSVSHSLHPLRSRVSGLIKATQALFTLVGYFFWSEQAQTIPTTSCSLLET